MRLSIEVMADKHEEYQQLLKELALNDAVQKVKFTKKKTTKKVA